MSSAALRYGEPAAGEGTGPRIGPQNIEKTPAQELPVHALSPGLHLRQGGINTAYLQLLVEASGRTELPPVLVQKDGWRIIDGLHRLEAAKLCGDHSIKARLVECTDAEALVLAMKANSSHGLPLSRADRIAGAERVLLAHPEWSDRAIASVTGLSAKTIAVLRERSACATPPGGQRLGLDGKLRSVGAGEGRRRAAAYIHAHPEATLREVARETEVSLGTVHDVSARLRRGVSPERNGLRAPGAHLTLHPADRPADTPPTAHPAPRPDRHAPPQAAEAAPAWETVAAKVAGDPCIRYTAGGKEFLQWMALHAGDPDGWRELVNAVPAHWVGVIAPIAESVGREWSQFAERLRSRQEAV
ncbi:MULTISPECIES: ParB/RepB/Spo0J family partition protein [unclassified Streptomyces]|uniref:ParB/RepB/Spo0J family partition protein n=1 Tax=unclassified Streptomyces TaxID=2593676 RepID=UPI002285C5C6|nr:ParB N-terminal domain-containing protein [Streptomyces sp. Je 1-369]WAL93064.1 ParB N-terminal domain-containing protein [Streptomyces sp. Je 1-369]WAL99916.1 ParB N-terminal domain-containing protein [Streptomyces sp. Je 1-369]